MAEQIQRSIKKVEQLYLAADFYLVRAPALSAQIFMQLSNTGHVCPEVEMEEKLEEALQKGRQECEVMLLKLAQKPEIALAVAVASPSLVEGLERLQKGEMRKARQKRVYASLLRYLIRMSTRPTPFGLFAGVGLGQFGEKTNLCLGTAAIKGFRTRPDMSWLLALLRQIEEGPKLVAQLQVQLNQTAYLVGERAMLPLSDIYGVADSRTISLRATTVVRKVFEMARQPISYAALHRGVQETFPRSTNEQIDHLLWQLWEHHFLISQLHPPLTHAQPISYVREQLERMQDVEEIEEGINQVIAACKVLDETGISAPISLVKKLIKHQERLLSTTEKGNLATREQERLPLQVDAALFLEASTMHSSIGQAAARAATLLLRQTPLTEGFSHLQEYRIQFQEVYGEGAEVPLLDLLSPENGLDAPPDYDRPPPTYQRPFRIPPKESGPRDRLLLELVLEAVNRGHHEVVLTEDLQSRLQRWSPNLREAPLSLEIYLQLHAASREAIDRGEWMAVVGRNCGSLNGGRTFGRFFDLLAEPGLEALRSFFAREEALRPDVIFAEMSYQPWQARSANVAIRPPLREYEIAVGTTPSVPTERVIPLSDLVVGVRNGRFYLRSKRLGKQVLACQSHMLNPRLAPNVCRFISEIASDGLPILSAFDWGLADHSPFLPRLVMKEGDTGKLVLTSARWYLHEETITPVGTGSEEARWFRGVQQWRKQWHVPRYIYLSEMDHRLLLDLEHPLMVGELRDEIRRLKGSRRVALEELLPDFEHLWLQDMQGAGYFSEIVVPLLRVDAFEQSTRTDNSTSYTLVGKNAATPSSGEKAPSIKKEDQQWIERRDQVLTTAERRRFPGEDWAYLKLYAAISQHEALIAGPLRQVIQTLQAPDLIDRWFFVRYCDPEPHLRLRFHAKDGVNIQAIHAIILSWSLHLARHGLLQHSTLETYDREVERYGGPLAIDLMEQVFTVDSAVVSGIIAAQYAHQITLDPVAVLVWTLDQFFAAWGWDMQQRREWVQTITKNYAFSKEYHLERRRYCDLFVPHGYIEPDLAEQRTQLLKLTWPQREYLENLGTQIRHLDKLRKLWVDESELMQSLAHMHVNRLGGIDPVKEAQVFAFWRHTLESLAQRPEGNGRKGEGIW